jgi:hypothetical protein
MIQYAISSRIILECVFRSTDVSEAQTVGWAVLRRGWLILRSDDGETGLWVTVGELARGVTEGGTAVPHDLSMFLCVNEKDVHTTDTREVPLQSFSEDA